MLICSLNKFTEQLRGKEKRPFRAASIELTRRCTFSCRQCYCVSPRDSKQATKELSLHDWERILRQCADEGVLYLTFTGGEPLLHPDFQEIWIAAKRQGFLIDLFSNGSLIDDAAADFLAEWTPLEVSLTLYGASEETYQEVTGVKGMFQRTLDAFERLTKRKVNIEVKGVFSQLSIHDYEAVREIALKYCDVFRWDGLLMGAFAGCDNKPQEIRLSVEQLVALELADQYRQEGFATMTEKWKPVSLNTNEFFRCGVGRGAHIDAFGGMHPCLTLESLKYDLLCGSVSEGWNHAIPQMLANVKWKPGPCQTCDAAVICCNCAAFAILEDCPPAGPVPYRCALAKARAQAIGVSDFLLNVPEEFNAQN